MKLRATVTVEYDADPAHYGTSDPADMAEVDAENWRNDPVMFWSSFEDGDYKVTVEPIDGGAA